MKVMKVKIVTGKQYFLFLYAINYNNFGQSSIHSFKGSKLTFQKFFACFR